MKIGKIGESEKVLESDNKRIGKIVESENENWLNRRIGKILESDNRRIGKIVESENENW